MSQTQTEEATTYSYKDRLVGFLPPPLNTAITYRSGVLSFLRSVYGSDEGPETLAPRYIAEMKEGQRNYLKDLIGYMAAAKEATSHPRELLPSSASCGRFTFFASLAHLHLGKTCLCIMLVLHSLKTQVRQKTLTRQHWRTELS